MLHVTKIEKGQSWLRLHPKFGLGMKVRSRFREQLGNSNNILLHEQA